nr:MAG TPA: hypothetical protein [Caudoviricetes sp.]
MYGIESRTWIERLLCFLLAAVLFFIQMLNITQCKKIYCDLFCYYITI